MFTAPLGFVTVWYTRILVRFRNVDGRFGDVFGTEGSLGRPGDGRFGDVFGTEGSLGRPGDGRFGDVFGTEGSFGRPYHGRFGTDGKLGISSGLIEGVRYPLFSAGSSAACEHDTCVSL